MASPSLTPANVAVALIGAGFLALFAWSWAGRSRAARWWAGRPFGRQLMLAMVPGLGLLVLSAGVLTLAGTSSAPLVALPFLLDVLPRWWAPAWYRRLPPTDRR